MSRTFGSPSWAPKLPRYKNASRQAQLEKSVRGQTMGQTPSHEAETGINGNPRSLELYDPADRASGKISPHATSDSTTKATAHCKDSSRQDDAARGVDEDDESEWSDWNAKASTTAKRTSKPDGDLGLPTYDTTSGTEEDVSEGEDQLSLATNSTPGLREQGFSHIEAPVDKPAHSGEHDIQEGEEHENLQDTAPPSRQGDVQMVSSDEEADSESGDDDPSSTEDLKDEPVEARSAHKAGRASFEQPPRLEEKPKPNSPKVRDAGQQDEGLVPVRTAASDQHTSSASSIFDPVQDSELLGTAPLQNANLKRKRRSVGDRALNVRGQPTHKRRKHNIFSPPTSVSSEGEDISTEPSSTWKAIQGRFKIHCPVVKPKATEQHAPQDQGYVDTWVKPLSLNSSLKHPLFNPSPSKRPNRVDGTDRLAQSANPSAASGSSGPSRFNTMPWQGKDDSPSIVEDSSNDEAPSNRGATRTVSTSLKGKSKALPGIRYSSPANVSDRATSLRSSKKSGGKRRPPLSKSSPTRDNSLNHEVDQRNMEDSEAGSDVNDWDAETAESMEDATALKVLTCKTCNRKFAREEQLRSHKKNNSAHAKSYECWKCGKEYDEKRLLIRHQASEKHPKETFHAQKTGPFSDNEIRKLKQFMEDYCDQHGISEADFRQMMTDSSRRGRNETWSWPGVTRKEFLNEYYDVLPNRAQKSMQRYKERYFQNLDHNKKWTEEDDKLLLKLVDELGPKWVEIGLRLTRTQDSVTTRYKKKLKDRSTVRSGMWSHHEKQMLAKAIEDIKDELGLEKSPDTDSTIVWAEVSKRMGGIRTADQCSTHWHRVLKRKQKSRSQGTKGGRELKSKEFVSSDTDNEPGALASEPHRERFIGISLPKMPTGSAHDAELTNSSESDSAGLGTQQDNEDPRRRPYIATRRHISPQLGSLDQGELDATPSSGEAPGNDVADPIDHSNNINEPVERTADEWERLLAAEESLPTLDTMDLEYGIPETQTNQDDSKNRFGEVPHHTSSARRKSPAADSKPSRNPLDKKTPGKVMPLSQAFEQTQAPTSVLRQLTPFGLEGPTSSRSRPSPDIGLRLRPTPQDLSISPQEYLRQSPLAAAGGNNMNHDVEVEETDDSIDGSDENTEGEDVEQSGYDNRTQEEHNVASLEHSPSEDLDGEEDCISARGAASGTANHQENGTLVNGEAESGRDDDTSEDDDTSDDDNTSEEDENSEVGSKSGKGGSVSEYESAKNGDSDDGDGQEESNDSMVKDTHSDFMTNIKESAKLSRLQSPYKPRSIAEESDDEEDDDDDTE